MVYNYSASDNKIGLPKLDNEETGGVGGWLTCRILACDLSSKHHEQNGVDD
jgi:hypothetical protein